MPDQLPFKICLTGGGTAGHVTPHFALLPGIKARGWGVFYIGSRGLERPLVEAQGIPFETVAAGKLRRYVDLQNLIDLFKVGVGCLQAFVILLRRRPDAVFSKGGFVAVPVAWAAWLLRIPVVSHESDLTPGLANKLIAPIARKLIYTFPETRKYLKPDAELVGTPVRPELLTGSRERGLAVTGFGARDDVPTYLVMGGSQGAKRLNDALLAALPELTKRARVIHLTGKGKGIPFTHARYKAFEYVQDELKDLFALTDFVVSRAGANSLFEFLALKKPMLLVPLEQGSRGDQVVNAEAFSAQGWAHVLREKDLTDASFAAALDRLAAAAPEIIEKQRAYDGTGVADKILGVIAKAAGRS